MTFLKDKTINDAVGEPVTGQCEVSDNHDDITEPPHPLRVDATVIYIMS